jgi:hypothetical protein
MIANHGDQADKCEGHYIKCSVSADGSNYTITMPSTKHERTFQTRGR